MTAAIAKTAKFKTHVVQFLMAKYYSAAVIHQEEIVTEYGTKVYEYK